MNVTLELYYPEEMRAYAVFLNTVADQIEQRRKDDPDRGLIGGIAALAPSVWKTATEAGADQQTAALVLDEKAFLGEQAQQGATAVRKRGEPSPGHKRRTKAEIAEDEAKDKAEAGATQTLTGAIRDTPAISTGGERVAPDDDPETVQADAKDEAAETAKAGAELSHENLRDALGKYVQKFGMDAAQLDGPKLFTLVFKDPAITKISAVPAGQASLKKALDGVNEMLAKNPFDRTPVA